MPDYFAKDYEEEAATDDRSHTRLSLTKLVGEKPYDVVGYISADDGIPVFQITHILMQNGAEIWVEGEHDCPYLGDVTDADQHTYPHMRLMLSEEVMRDLFDTSS